MYMIGFKQQLTLKRQYPSLKMILHSDQDSVYAPKEFNDLFPSYNITKSMSSLLIMVQWNQLMDG